MKKMFLMNHARKAGLVLALSLAACGSDPEEGLDNRLIVEILSGPAELTNQTTAEFELGCNIENGCDFLCGFDEEALDTCESSIRYDDLEDGEHHFYALAIDEDEESETLQWSWTIDTVDPEIEITAAPDAISADEDAAFEFQCANKPQCDFECSLGGGDDPGSFELCSSPHQFSGLEEGDYELQIKAVDQAGNEALKSYQWTVVTAGEDDGVEGWKSFDLGEAHGCAIDFEESLWCWGTGSSGELGLGDSWLRYTPEKVAAGTDLERGWKSFSGGRYHSCAIRTDDTLWCWGDGDNGRTGLGDEEERLFPEQVAAGTEIESGWSSIFAMSTHTCAIRDDDTLWCWGNGTALGLGEDLEDQLTPRQVGVGTDLETGWTDISGGFRYTCGIHNDDTLWCWGNAQSVGLGSDIDSPTEPTQLALETDHETGWSQVHALNNHTCALRHDESIYCWGVRLRGRLGSGEDLSYEEALFPTLVAPGSDLSQGWTAVSAGGNHSCGLRSDQTLWCWGDNGDGELGLGDENIERSWTPLQVEAQSELATGWTSVRAGLSYSCALRDDHSLWCWGNSGRGRLGLGQNVDDQSAPQLVELATED